MSDRTLNLRYAGVQAAYFLYFAVISSFASIFLLSRGYNSSRIGLILAAGNVAAVAISPLLADLADRRGGMFLFRAVVVLGLIAASMTAILMVLRTSSLLMSLVYITAFAVMQILSPMCTSIFRRFEEAGRQMNFGACRAGGSFAYATLCLFLGTLADRYGTGLLPKAGLMMIALFIAAVAISAGDYGRVTAEQAAVHQAAVHQAAVHQAASADVGRKPGPQTSLAKFMRSHRAFMILCLGALGIYYANQGVNTFMAQIVAGLGGSSEDTGRIFGLLAYLEIPSMLLNARLCRRFNCQRLLKFSAAAYVLWTAMYAIAQNVGMIFATQLLEPLGFALFYPTMVRFIADNMPRTESVKGQTAFAMAITAASVLSSLTGGAIIDHAGPRAFAMTATAMAALGALIIFAVIGRAARESAGLMAGKEDTYGKRTEQDTDR